MPVFNMGTYLTVYKKRLLVHDYSSEIQSVHMNTILEASSPPQVTLRRLNYCI